MRHYFDSRRSNRSGRFLLPKTNTTRYKASFPPSALSVLMKMIMVINLVCACVNTCAEDDDFQSLSEGGREGGRERERQRERERERERETQKLESVLVLTTRC